MIVARTYTYLLNLIAWPDAFHILQTSRLQGDFLFASVVYLAAFPPHTLLAPQWSYLRVILGLFPLLLVDLYFRSHKKYLLFIAGLLTGQSLLFSQEVGVCSLSSQLAYLFLSRFSVQGWKEGWKEFLILLVSTFLSVLPMLTVFYFKGALRAVLENVYEYPKYFALGYGSLPFLNLRDFLSTPTTEGMLFAYWIIFVYVVCAIFLLSSAFLFPDTRRPISKDLGPSFRYSFVPVLPGAIGRTPRPFCFSAGLSSRVSFAGRHLEEFSESSLCFPEGWKCFVGRRSATPTLFSFQQAGSSEKPDPGGDHSRDSIPSEGVPSCRRLPTSRDREGRHPV